MDGELGVLGRCRAGVTGEEFLEEAGPHDAGEDGAAEDVGAGFGADGDLGEDGAGAGAGDGHAGAEDGAAEDVAVILGEEA